MPLDPRRGGGLPVMPSGIDQASESLATACIRVSLKTDQASLCAAAYQHDRRIRIYETENDWRLRKDVHARNLRWTVTDTCLSPDQRFLLYSSITPTVHMVSPFWQACSRVDTIGGSTHGPGLRRHQE